MVNDVITIIKRKTISPYCNLSERGLAALFAGSLDVVHLSVSDTLEVKPKSHQYITVLRGEVEVVGQTKRHANQRIRSATTAASPFVFQADEEIIRLVALEDTLLLHGSGDVIDEIISIDALAGNIEQDVDVLQLVLMRNSKGFSMLPTSVLFDVYARMSEMKVSAGEEVIRQDMKGDLFYFIRDGAAEVWREELEDDEPQHVATLATGDSFGEEALILEAGRNATVKMITEGSLLTLDGDSYKDLIAKPAAIRISKQDAQSRLEKGAQLLDVRYIDEWEESYIAGAAHIPLSDIRLRMSELDKSREIVVYCRSGRRSQVGAILLSQYGFDAVSMDGGILGWSQ